MSTVVPLFDWYESAYIGGTLQLQTMMGWGTMMTHPAAGQKSPIDPTAWNWERSFSPSASRYVGRTDRCRGPLSASLDRTSDL